jgi:hypothetical protein
VSGRRYCRCRQLGFNRKICQAGNASASTYSGSEPYQL